jgi:hypothetical protein
VDAHNLQDSARLPEPSSRLHATPQDSPSGPGRWVSRSIFCAIVVCFAGPFFTSCDSGSTYTGYQLMRGQASDDLGGLQYFVIAAFGFALLGFGLSFLRSHWGLSGPALAGLGGAGFLLVSDTSPKISSTHWGWDSSFLLFFGVFVTDSILAFGARRRRRRAARSQHPT